MAAAEQREPRAEVVIEIKMLLGARVHTEETRLLVISTDVYKYAFHLPRFLRPVRHAA